MGCFLKIKELVNLLKKNPYMDIASSQELARVLQEEEERAIRERDIFAADLENKRYDGNDTPVILEREKYLEQQKIELEKELIECQNKIRKIDMEKVRILNSLLSSANQISENLRKELAENKQVMEANMENATPRKKAILIAAYNKKEEELSVVQKIIESYETEMQDLMKQSQMIEENEIQAIQTKMTKIAEDLKDIHKKTMISSKTKDVLAVENDKTRLKELTDRVKEINTIKKFSQTPSEIYDEVEMILGSFITNQEIDEEPKPVIEEPENTLMNNFRIATEPENDKDTYNRSEKNKDVLIEESQEESKENDNSINWFETPVEENVAITPIDMNIESINTPVEETPNIGPSLNVETPLDFQESAPTDFVMDSFNTPLNDVSSTKENTILEPNITLEPTKEIEPINMDEIIPLGTIDNTPLKERWKVIHVEPLESTTTTPKEPTLSSEDVMISDFKDEDYVDFNTLLDGGNV